jgi:integrase
MAIESSPAIAVRPSASPGDLAPALVQAAGMPLPLSGAAIDRWWAQASMSERTGLVWRIVRALPHVGGYAGTRLADPAWRYEAGVPLALATYVLSMRLRRRHRAANTLRAWRSDWKQWRAWCKAERLPSFNPSAAQLKRFFDWYAPAHKVSTIQRLGATLTAMHEAAGFPNPLSQPIQHEIWIDAITPPSHKASKQRRKRKDAPGQDEIPLDRRDAPIDQARGLRHEILVEIRAAIDTTTLIGARDAALLSVLYDLMGRRSECTALRVVDITADPKDGSATATIRRSKTDQKGDGRVLYLRPDSFAALCHWLASAKISSGPLWRSLTGFSAKGKPATLPPLESREVSRIIKRRVGAIKNGDGKPKYDAELFSGHSCRVGAAQDMAEAGRSDLEIMLAGRWKSLSMVARYTEAIRAKHGGMAKLARTQMQPQQSVS